VDAVALSFTPRGRQQTAADPRFRRDGLLAAVESELRARSLFDGPRSPPGRTIDIAVDDFTTRPMSNVVLFGYTVSDGALAADVAVRAADGRRERDFRVEASTRLVAAGGAAAAAAGPADAAAAATPLDALYRRFAVLTVDRLTGVVTKSIAAAPDDGRPH
jgi:hypothetical protein